MFAPGKVGTVGTVDPVCIHIVGWYGWYCWYGGVFRIVGTVRTVRTDGTAWMVWWVGMVAWYGWCGWANHWLELETTGTRFKRCGWHDGFALGNSGKITMRRKAIQCVSTFLDTQDSKQVALHAFNAWVRGFIDFAVVEQCHHPALCPSSVPCQQKVRSLHPRFQEDCFDLTVHLIDLSQFPQGRPGNEGKIEGGLGSEQPPL